MHSCIDKIGLANTKVMLVAVVYAPVFYNFVEITSSGVAVQV